MNDDIESIERLVLESVKPTVKLAGPVDPDDCIPFLVVPDKCRIHSLEELLARPVMKRGRAVLGDVESFTRYVNEHKTPATRIFASPQREFTALIDFHDQLPAWRRHKAVFIPVPHPSWVRWQEVNGEAMNQQDFVEFIERNAADISGAAALLEVAEDVSAHIEARYDQKIGTHDGKTRVLFSEDLKLTGGGMSTRTAAIDFPKEVRTIFPVLSGGENIPLVWRLRPKVDDGQLWFIVELPTAPEILQTAYAELSVTIEEDTGIKPFTGSFE